MFSLLLVGLVMARPVDAQVKFGVQGAVMTGVDQLALSPDMNGTFGLGGRVAFQPPVLPVGALAQGVYYFPEGDVGYQTYSLAGQLRLPLPVASPYVLAGWQWRRTSFADASNTENGPVIGLGVQLNLGISAFVEGGFEFNDEIPSQPDFDNNPIVIKAGVLFGG